MSYYFSVSAVFKQEYESMLLSGLKLSSFLSELFVESVSKLCLTYILLPVQKKHLRYFT